MVLPPSLNRKSGCLHKQRSFLFPVWARVPRPGRALLSLLHSSCRYSVLITQSVLPSVFLIDPQRSIFSHTALRLLCTQYKFPWCIRGRALFCQHFAGARGRSQVETQEERACPPMPWPSTSENWSWFMQSHFELMSSICQQIWGNQLSITCPLVWEFRHFPHFSENTSYIS